MKYKYPLLINLFWDNANSEMHNLANQVYQFYSRDIQQPLERQLSIPVHRFTKIPKTKELLLKESEFCANIFLVDETMLLDKGWKRFYISVLNANASVSKRRRHRSFVASFTKKGYKFSGLNQCYRLEELGNNSGTKLLIRLSHDISRLLHNKLSSYIKNQPRFSPPVKLFLSHAIADGRELIENLKKRIDETPTLDSFVDAYDIYGGEQFAIAFERNIAQSVLVVIQTDKYSSREWCRKEFLLAKTKERPIIVINKLKKGESRIFPYGGNVANIIYNEDNSSQIDELDLILLEALKEVIRITHYKHNKRLLKKYSRTEPLREFNYPPELLSMICFPRNRKGLVLYPDPPLGSVEIDLLRRMNNKINYITPTLLPLMTKSNKTIKTLDLSVAISLSETNSTETAKFDNEDIANLMVQIVRHLLVANVQLVYGGYINYGTKSVAPGAKFNFTRTIIDLIRTYKEYYTNVANHELKPLENISGFPLNTLLTKKYKAEYLDLVNFTEVPPPKNLNITKKQGLQILSGDTPEKLYVWAKSMTAMREKIMNSSDALIVLGGKNHGFKSKIPGVLEETILALKVQKPIFILGGFGGVAKDISIVLRGKSNYNFSLDYFRNINKNYYEFISFFNNWPLTLNDEKIDYSTYVRFLRQAGKNSNSFGLNNGLNRTENMRLFESKNETEIIHLLLKGLQSIKK